MPWGNCVTKDGVATLACIGPLFQNILGVLLSFAGVVALFFIILGGFKFITSGGDPKQVEGARQTLTYAIIGLVVILLSFFIINLIAETTGATCIKLFGFSNCGEPRVTGGGGGAEFAP
jgi:hypothetical protein